MKIRNHNGTQPGNCEYKIAVNANKPNRKKAAKDIALKQNVPPHSPNKSKPTKSHENKFTEREPRQIQKKPQQCSVFQYEQEISSYLRSKEQSYMINTHELRKNQVMTRKVRAFILKFFFKIKFNFKLKRKTVHLAAFYLDLYLTKNTRIDRKQLVIYSQAALWMAMKYEEIYPPELSEWVSDSKVNAVLKAQAQILYALEFRLVVETRQGFFEHYLAKNSCKIDKSSEKMMKTLVDLSLFDDSMHSHKPSELVKWISRSILYPKGVDERTDMIIKWMIEKNQSSLQWLQQNQDRILSN